LCSPPANLPIIIIVVVVAVVVVVVVKIAYLFVGVKVGETVVRRSYFRHVLNTTLSSIRSQFTPLRPSSRSPRLCCHTPGRPPAADRQSAAVAKLPSPRRRQNRRSTTPSSIFLP